MSRREWLGVAGITAASAAVAASPAAALAKSNGHTDSSYGASGKGRGDKNPEQFSTRLVLLGVAGGPAWNTSHGVSSALAVGDRNYVIDCGEGAWHQYRNNLAPQSPLIQSMHSLRAVFLTHMHSDHIIDYNNLFLSGIPAGIGATQHVDIYGPGDRGSLPPLFGPAPAPPVVNPSNPTPGTVDMTNMLIDAYAADINDRRRDTRFADVLSRVTPHDIALPASIVANANTDPAPDMDPFDVFEDDRVKVTAILGRHAPTFPTFAFRFDTDDGSIVFSGDTAKEANVIKLAENADVLVHEVLDPDWPPTLFPDPTTPFAQAVINHIISAHTPIKEVGEVATEANVKTLVLNHFAPADITPRSKWLTVSDTFDGRVVVGEDGVQVGLGARKRGKN